VSSGVVQLPASFREQVRGRYALRTEDGLTVGQLVISDQATWGLGPLFRRRGGEQGDRLLLTFSLQQREVTARLDDMTVIPEPGNVQSTGTRGQKEQELLLLSKDEPTKPKPTPAAPVCFRAGETDPESRFSLGVSPSGPGARTSSETGGNSGRGY